MKGEQMIVLCIILGILVGVPVYLLLNTFLGLIIRPFAAMCALLYSDSMSGSFMDQIKGGPNSLTISLRTQIKFAGLLFLIAILVLTCGLVICRLFWLVYRGFRAWILFVKFCWNLGTSKK